jgi:hypothetical protein
VGTLENALVARKIWPFGYVSMPFSYSLKCAVNRLKNINGDDIRFVGDDPTALKFLSSIGGKKISRIKSCLSHLKRNTDNANDSGFGMEPVKYSLYIFPYKKGREIRANIALIVADTENMAGKSLSELNTKIKSAQWHTTAAIINFLENFQITKMTGILGNCGTKKQPKAD